MRKLLVASIALLAAIGVAAAPAHADTTTVVTASYVAGWNMAGGPPGTDLSAASALDAYGPNGYIPAPAPNPFGCQGYWALFARPATVNLPATATGPSQTCSLANGWNLVGNPFSGLAILPAGITAYYWNHDRETYDVVSQLQPGTSAWIDSTGPSSITLVYAPVVTRTPTILGIDSLAQTGPFTVHVGDSVELFLPAIAPYTATTDQSLLALEIAGLTGPTTCNVTCAISLLNQIWIWHAVAPGTALITVSPLCTTTTSPCPTATTVITIDIVP